jgi:lipoprotein-releasing system permease protein
VNTEFFIAKKMIRHGKKQFSHSMMKISVFSIALSIIVMIISVAIVTGFQNEIRDKVVGFGGHIQITKYDVNHSLENKPIAKNEISKEDLLKEEGIEHIQAFSNKAGILKNKEQIYGVLLKGVGADYDWSFFENALLEGEIVKKNDSLSNAVLISEKISLALDLKVGDDLRTYFINPNEVQPRGRKFYVSGIYSTGMVQFDERVILGDMAHVQQLNGWGEDSVGGYEVLVSDFNRLDEITKFVYQNINYDLYAESIKEIEPQLFDWLGLLDMNVIVIIILMIIVAVMNIITALLILILEKTSFIGVLKALGFNNVSVRKIFIYNASYLVLKGLFWGNLIGLSLALIQQQFKLITLSQDSYYMPYVPINLQWDYILALNVGTIIICLFILIIPSMLISRVRPVKAIRFS